MSEIKDKKYTVAYIAEQAMVKCEGSLMLNGATAYEPILNLLKQAAEEQEPENLEINIRDMKFMNSSGINMITKFIMYISDVKEFNLSLTIAAQSQVAWQERLCINLKRLMPNLQTKLD